MNILGTLAFASGAILIYGAVRDKTPAQIFRELMAGGATAKTLPPSPGASLGGSVQRSGN